MARVEDKPLKLRQIQLERIEPHPIAGRLSDQHLGAQAPASACRS